MDKNKDTPQKNAHWNAKKRLLVIVIITVSILIVLIAASLIIDNITNHQDTGRDIDFDFYPADYQENIFEDEEYLSLIETDFLKYSNATTGLTLGITRDNAKEQGAEVEFLVEMLYDIVNGDHVSYNNRFSSAYYKKHSPKEMFTMQKIYDVTITYISSENVQVDEANDYTKSVYSIEYKIHENNGTFRRDIGAGSKKQYLTVTNASGNFLIDSITTVNY